MSNHLEFIFRKKDVGVNPTFFTDGSKLSEDFKLPISAIIKKAEWLRNNVGRKLK